VWHFNACLNAQYWIRVAADCLPVVGSIGGNTPSKRVIAVNRGAQVSSMIILPEASRAIPVTRVDAAAMDQLRQDDRQLPRLTAKTRQS
jgi:hypothetical protein